VLADLNHKGGATTAAINAYITPLAALSTNARIEIGIGAGVLIYVIINALVAGYGRTKGYPFFPLFVASLFIGFPVVLLVVTIAAGRRPQQP
jgi:hypothetical protein